MSSSQYPDVTVKPLTAGLLQSMIDTYVIKASPTSRASVTTSSDDPDLTFTGEANAVYHVTAVLLHGGQTAAGIKVSWNVPSGTSGLRRCNGPGSAASETNADNIALRRGVHVAASQIIYSNTRNSSALLVHSEEKALWTVGGVAGPITVQWAQGASSATATVMGAGSHLIYRRVG